MGASSPDGTVELENAAEWADLQALLSNCLKHPDEQLAAAIADGSLEADLDELAESVGVDRPGPIPESGDRDLTEEYEALFGALREPFAPPAASPYKEWYQNRDGGLMDGPPAARMEERLDALDASIPDAYPPDHVALQLEYASLLAETGSIEDLAAFVESELDWIDAFARTVKDAAADAPFHRYCVGVLAAVVGDLRDELDITGPSAAEIDRMTDRTTSQRI